MKEEVALLLVERIGNSGRPIGHLRDDFANIAPHIRKERTMT